MSTMVTSTDRVATKTATSGKSKRSAGGNGASHRGNGGGDGAGGSASTGGVAERYRIGMYVALAGVVMLFTALTSAYIVRAAGATDWKPIGMPRLLWASTGLIAISSVTFELARKALKRENHGIYGRWLLVTVALGLGFLCTQFLAWRELVAQGVYLSSNPHSAFFYLLTALHAVHLLGGILALDYLLLHAWRRRAPEQIGAKRAAAAGAVAIYWHFMDGLWIFLFLLLFLWR